MYIKHFNSIITLLLFYVLFGCVPTTFEKPFTVKTDLYHQNDTIALGLKLPENIETISIFKPTDSTDHFSNGVVMTVFKNQFYCQWQSSAKDEDAHDTWVAYSKSEDGIHWSSPMILSKSLKRGITTSGGWLVHKNRLIAYINQWSSDIRPKGGNTFYKTSLDGINWSDEKPVLMADGTPIDAVFEQDPHVLPNGRIVGAAHFQPGLIVSPIYTDDPTGVSGWKKSKFTNNSIKKSVSREIEPSSYIKKNGSLVMIFRDQKSTYQSLASLSSDNGESWSKPVITDLPDSRSKQSAGNLANEIAYIINNPVDNKYRAPLVVSLSNNGEHFNTAYVLRKGGNNIQKQRYEGKYKRAGYHYPKSFVWQNNLYVSYATNKEDVEYTKVALSSLSISSTKYF